jgi:hypothetical protein
MTTHHQPHRHQHLVAAVGVATSAVPASARVIRGSPFFHVA